mmetsp:Transcript_51277/g.160150  ORF Transcript_51277/g.160150 Transcript_51277/m.160150 type:complete len:222 (-) Transcript_51277:419-1084(-)
MAMLMRETITTTCARAKALKWEQMEASTWESFGLTERKVTEFTKQLTEQDMKEAGDTTNRMETERRGLQMGMSTSANGQTVSFMVEEATPIPPARDTRATTSRIEPKVRGRTSGPTERFTRESLSTVRDMASAFRSLPMASDTKVSGRMACALGRVGTSGRMATDTAESLRTERDTEWELTSTRTEGVTSESSSTTRRPGLLPSPRISTHCLTTGSLSLGG